MTTRRAARVRDGCKFPHLRVTVMPRLGRFRLAVFCATILYALLFVGLMGVADCVLAQAVTINSGTSTYDFHPSAATVDTGATWYAWHGYRDGRDQIFARRVAADGQPETLHTMSTSGSIHGPPTIVGETDQYMFVVWPKKKDDRWQVVLSGSS